jgi:23S rRNA pseudouridine2457 synthase
LEDSGVHRHYKIYKPYKYLSQFVNNQSKRNNKRLLGELARFPDGIMSIGRLDEQSEGLLLLTTNGIVSEQVRSKKVEKEYYVEVDGQITDEAIDLLQLGVEIKLKRETYNTLPCAVFRINGIPQVASQPSRNRSSSHGPTSWISITLKEGKFRQVRKMTAAVGFPTVRLIRVRIGKMKVGQLNAGDVVEVSDFELG